MEGNGTWRGRGRFGASDLRQRSPAVRGWVEFVLHATERIVHLYVRSWVSCSLSAAPCCGLLGRFSQLLRRHHRNQQAGIRDESAEQRAAES